MKKLIIVALITLVFIANLIGNENDQNSKNKKYLILLDEDLISTIEMLDAFHQKSQIIYQDIEHGQDYDQFLMTMTMECSNLIENIRNTEGFSANEIEMQIQKLIATIKPDVEFSEDIIQEEENNTNKTYLEDVESNLNMQKKQLFQFIVNEEEKILAEGVIDNNYMRLHSHNFLFSLILNFIEPEQYLSKKNRNYLVDIVKSVDESLPKN